MSKPTTKTKPKPKSAKVAESSALDANPRKWLTITKRKGFAMIPHPLEPDAAMLAVYRVGVSYKPQPIQGTGTRFDGQTLHVMSMSSRHLSEDTGLNRRTIGRALRDLIADGWAARIRTTKKGQRGTAAYVFFTAEQRIEPRVTRAANGAFGTQSVTPRNGAKGTPLNGANGSQSRPLNGAFGTNEVSQPVAERQKKVPVASSIAEPSTASNAVLEREPEKPKSKPDPERAKEWDALLKTYNNLLTAERREPPCGLSASRRSRSRPRKAAAGRSQATATSQG